MIFALCAITYFIWLGRGKRKLALQRTEYNLFKQKLVYFFNETVKVKWRLNYVKSVDELRGLLDQAYEIKLCSLTELTYKELRGDNLFAIFIDQCGNLIMHIELRLERDTRTADVT